MNTKNLELPVHEVVIHNKLDNMVAYVSGTAFLAMTAMLLVILSL